MCWLFYEGAEGGAGMSEDTMLVRMPGGDVIRRAVAYRMYAYMPDGIRQVAQSEPETNEGEVVVRFIDDPIPRIINTK